jgi:activator of HSP90 ATPase
MDDRYNLEPLANKPTRRQTILSVVMTFGGLALWSAEARSEAEDEISHSAESIHQEAYFKAGPKRVYEVLTDARQFDGIVQLSAAMKSKSKALGDKPTEIINAEGGVFALFGGYITGRQIELLPNKRIVQAWRVGSWEPGVYSIAKFEFTEQDSGTKIVFDHTGFPKGLGEHLAAGWKGNYWEPLEKFLT